MPATNTNTIHPIDRSPRLFVKSALPLRHALHVLSFLTESASLWSSRRLVVYLTAESIASVAIIARSYSRRRANPVPPLVTTSTQYHRFGVWGEVHTWEACQPITQSAERKALDTARQTTGWIKCQEAFRRNFSKVRKPNTKDRCVVRILLPLERPS